MARTNFEKLEVYILAEKLADAIWDIVIKWPGFWRYTVGGQMCRAADGIGSHIAEGAGRSSFQDNRRFVRIARASLYETKYWLRRIYKRNLLTPEQVNQLKPLVDELSPKLNNYLKSIGRVPKVDSSDCGLETTDN